MRELKKALGRSAATLLLMAGAGTLHAAPPQIDGPYPELLGGVCTDLGAITPSTAPSLEGKEFLLEEADRLNLPHDLRALLAERLRHNAFSIAEDQLWKPFESFDIALQSRDAEAGILKARFSSQRFGEYDERVGELPPAQRDALRRAALSILAETGHLPEIVTRGERLHFVWREACLVDDGPGLMTTFIQGRLREFDPATGTLGRTWPLKPEKATISDPSLAFTSSGKDVIGHRTAQVERAFAEPATRELLRTIHAEILDLIEQPERMRVRIEQLIGVIEIAYGIDPVNFDFDTAPRESGGSGYYYHSARTYQFHFDRFRQKLDRLVEREGLDLTRSTDRAVAARQLYGELVNNAVHELTHAGQYQWLDTAAADPASIPETLRARVDDYRTNTRYKNTAWESHALIGLVGGADYDRYRYQPIEEDAWAVGGYAETLALQAVMPDQPPRGNDSVAPALQAAEGAPVRTPVALAPAR